MREQTIDESQNFYEKHFPRGNDLAQIPKDDDFMYAQVIRQLRSYLHPNTEVLDLGCNNGNLSLYMALYGCNVLGIDLARNVIETARESANYYQIHNAQFEAMNFVSDWKTPKIFDFILCSHVIEHVPRDDLFLHKLFLATKPKGTLLLITPTVYSSFYILNRYLKGFVQHDQQVGHLRRYSEITICNRVKRAGFEIKKTVFLDSVLRDWFILGKRLRRFNSIWSLPFIRKAFNNCDSYMASFFLFPSAICVHAQRIEQAGSSHNG
jgi:2-polyprenyl-3-methyl-5-hydroxy-6-metoxy-1,4-benzoquinol methylase